VPTRLDSVVFDAADHVALARWWGEALGWPMHVDEEDDGIVTAPEESGLTGLVFCAVDDPKVGRNRVHLDLASSSTEAQATAVERLVATGARRVDIGQGDVPWVVLADPEGNELCVLEPRPVFARFGSLAAVVVDAADPDALAPFWEAAAGWTTAIRTDHFVGLRPPGDAGPGLALVRVADPNVVKNRVHLDVRPSAGDDQRAEVDRLLALGARPVDVGQTGDESWVVLADPEGNELCVLRPG
jgi:predicted enzyme related to lactoylglutathione lyase